MDKKCKKLGNQATKRERAEAHRAKMEMKQALGSDYNTAAEYERPDYILANISRNHEHYGDTPEEHERRKRGEFSS